MERLTDKELQELEMLIEYTGCDSELAIKAHDEIIALRDVVNAAVEWRKACAFDCGCRYCRAIVIALEEYRNATTEEH